MSTATVPVIEHTVQQTHVWLKAIAEKLHLTDQLHAYSALRAVLHALRGPAHAGERRASHCPTANPRPWRLLRGLAHRRQADARPQRAGICRPVAAALPAQFPMDPLAVSRGVFEVLFERLDPGESAKVIDKLPVPLRGLWPSIARRD